MSKNALRFGLVALCAMALTFGALASAQAAPVTVSKVVISIKGVATVQPTQLQNLTITPEVLSSFSTTSTADTKRIGTAKSSWVTSVVRKGYKAPVGAAYTYKKGVFKVRDAKTGTKLTNTQVYNAVLRALRSAPLDGSAVKVVITPTKTKAKIYSRSKLGKCIVVDKSQRRLWLYNKGKKTSYSYRVTIGMKGHSTPSGVYTIKVKRSHPTWVAPPSKWAANMPRVIGPGPNNPLGLRAMNMYQKGHDTGLRIHGTSNLRQIGRAASHGCIRVANKNIVKLFKVTPLNTKVYVQR